MPPRHRGLPCLVPRHFHLPALVAQVAGHGGGEDDFIDTAHGILALEPRALVAVGGAEVGRRAGRAVAEDDELDAVEAQQLGAQLVAGIGVAGVVRTYSLAASSK